MVDCRHYPERKLSKEETSERKQLIEDEHEKLENQWFRADLQPVFDVGRLGSPMWQAYRHLFKDRAKANKKVPWESKWKHPEAFKQTKHEFLHLKADKYTMKHYLDNDKEDVEPTKELKGLGGSYSEITFSLLKHEMAKVKHSSKFHLSEEEKNMVLLPGTFTEYSQHPKTMSLVWDQYGHGRKPWNFGRVFIAGSVVTPKILWVEGGPHAVLFLMNFEEKPYKIEWYDSAHCNWKKLCETIRDWLVNEQGMLRKDGEDMKFKAHNEVPLQMDPFNCGQNMMKTARALIRGETPDYDTYRASWTEMTELLRYAFKGKYKHGRTNFLGRKSHPTIDKVVEGFSKQKVEDHSRLKKWQTKPMKGFK
jgi:hypothetical protein